MSQKTNPVSLRLQKTNKSFSSCWYSDFFYDRHLYHDFKIRSYIETVAEQVGHLQMLSYLQIHYKRSYMHLFFSDKRGIREEREKSLKISRKSTQFIEQKIKMPLLLLLYNSKSQTKNSVTQQNNTVEIAPLMALSFANSIFMYQSARESITPLVYTRETTTHLSDSKDAHTRPLGGSSKADEQDLDLLKGMETYLTSKHSKAQKVLASASSMNQKNSTSPTDNMFANIQLQQKCIESLRNQDKTSIDLVLKKKKEYNYLLYFQILSHICRKNNTFAKKTNYVINGTTSLISKAYSVYIPKLAPSIARMTAQQFRVQNLSKFVKNRLERLGGGQPKLPWQRPISFADTYTHEKGLLKRPPLREKEIPLAFILRELQAQPASLTTRGLQFHHFFGINPIRIVQDAQSAAFLANEIVHLIQKGVSFRIIKDQVLRDLTKNVNVKGVRFSCSGRIGGRSKKAQKTKKQSIQWGETSLHVFSSKLSFAKGSAATPFGKVGIKVWVCYK